MAYAYLASTGASFATKKALKEAVAAGKKVIAKDNTPWGQKPIDNGSACIEGPCAPKPHSWYASVTVENGYITKVK